MSSFFTAPWMLAWLGALAVPILIHLFARQRFRPVPWAAMELLQRAFKKIRRRVRLEHLLLLLLRLLALLLLVLALAGPIMDRSGLSALGGLGGGRRELVLVLDDSFSTDLKGPDGATEFARLQGAARTLVQGLRKDRGDAVSIIRASKPASLVLRSSTDLDKVVAEIDGLERSDKVSDLAPALEIAVAILADQGAPAEVWLLSDLQRSAFVPVPTLADGEVAATPEKAIGARLLDLKGIKALTSVLIPRAIPTDNLAIVGLRQRSKAAIVGQPVHFEVTLANYAADPRGGRVDFFIEGRPEAVEIRDVDAVPPGGTVVVDFHTSFRTQGSHTVQARFQDDNLEPDNRRNLTVSVRSNLDVVIVDGDPAGEPGEEESFFLAAALNPGGNDGAVASTFSVDVVDDARFPRVALDDVDILVLMDLSILSSERAEAIHTFVEEGGGLLVFLGDRTNASLLNDQLWREGKGVLPAKLLSVAETARGNAEISFRMRVERFDHPALAYFEDPAITPWLTEIPPFERFYRTEVLADDDTVRVLAEFELPRAATPVRAPALIEKRFGEGRAILFTTSGDRTWTDLPALPTWLLLTRELAFHLATRDAESGARLVGQRFEKRLKTPATSAALSRDGEALEELPILSPEGSRRFDLSTGALEKAGLYRLDLRGQAAPTARDPNPIHIAVNVDPLESRLDRVDPAWLENQYPEAGLRFVSDVQEDTSGPRRADGRNAWWWLLLLAGLAFAAETVLAQIFGSRRERGGAA